MKNLLIIGASGHGKVVADIARKRGYEEIAFLDDNDTVKECMGYPVLGTSKDIEKYSSCDFVVAIGNPIIREKVQKQLLSKNINVATLIHPNTVIGDNVKVGLGTVVMAGAVINPDSIVGNGCIINTGATVDHDNAIQDYAHISVGSHLAGTVSVGKRTWVGAGAVVSNNITICHDCMIGAGTVVVKDINEPGTYIGVPARKM